MDARSRASRRGPAAGATWRALVAAAMWATSAGVAMAGQAMQVQAGSSSLYDAHGGSIEARGRSVALTVGAGTLHDRFTMGGRLQKTSRGMTYSFGDDTIDFQLPTDVFGVGRYLPVRGAGVAWTRNGAQVRSFAGTTSVNAGAPFFRGAEWGRALGLLFVDVPRGPRWRVVSRNALTDRPTSIHGVEWSPRQSLSLAGSGGLGAGHPYLSVSTNVDHGWISTSAVYTTRDAGFRRIEPRSPMASEVEGGNLSITIKPQPWWSVSGTRQNFVDADPSGPDTKRATVNQLGSNVNVAGSRFAVAVFDSRREGKTNLGTSASVGRRISQSVDVGVDYFRSDPNDGSASESVLGRFQEEVTPRLSLLQVVTRNGKQTSVNLGGRFLSNVITVGLGYQTVYAPFRVGSPFVQMVALDLRIQVLEFQLQVGTYAAPDGHLRYTISGGRVLSAPAGSGDQTAAFKFAKYMVRGSVQDVEGRPVPGASIRIGEEIVTTGDDGLFFLRTAHKDTLVLSVLTAEFTTHGTFELVSAPAQVIPAPEAQASDIRIVVRRI